MLMFLSAQQSIEDMGSKQSEKSSDRT